MTNPILKILGQDATAPAWASAQRTAASGIDGIKSLIPGLAQVLSAAGMIAFAKSTIDAGDALNEMSQKTGQSVESLSKWRYIAEQSNTTLEAMEPAWKKLATNMADAAAGGKQQAEVFARMGVPVKDAAGNLRTLDDVMLDIADVFARMPDGPQKSALAVQVFGKAGLDMIQVVNRGRAELVGMGDDAKKMGMVMTTEAAKAAADLNDTFDLLSTAAKTLGYEMLNQAAPGIARVAEEMAKATREGGILWGLIIGYGQAFKSAIFDLGDKRGVDQQKQFIRELQNEYAQAAKNLEHVQKAGILGRAGFKSAQEYKNEIAALDFTIRQAVASLRMMEAEAAKPKTPPKKTGLKTGEIEDPEAAAAKAAREHAKAIKEKIEWQKQELDYQQRNNDAIDDAIATAQKQTDAEYDRRLAIEIAIGEQEAAAENAFIKEQQRTADELKQKEQAKFDSLRAGLMTEDEIRKFAYEADVTQLNKALDNKLVAQETYYTLMGRLIKKNEKAQTDIALEEYKKKHGLSVAYNKLNLDSAAGFAGQMSVLMQTNSRKMFEIGKVAAIAEVAAKTPAMAVKAYYSLAEIPFIGPVLGAAAAAAAIAYGAAQIQAINSTSFGGGGAIGTGVFAANPSTGLPESPTSSGFEAPPSPLEQRGVAAAVPLDVHISFSGSGLATEQDIRDLMKRIEEQSGNRISVVFSER